MQWNKRNKSVKKKLRQFLKTCSIACLKLNFFYSSKFKSPVGLSCKNKDDDDNWNCSSMTSHDLSEGRRGRRRHWTVAVEKKKKPT